MILADMSLITPNPGFVFWTALAFVLLWVILGKFAFKPIGRALRKREESITEALQSAEKAREEMAKLVSDNERLLAEAREERAQMLKSAKVSAEKIIAESRDTAREEGAKQLAIAKQEIENRKNAALIDLKNMAGQIGLEVAEQLIRRELKETKDQQDFVKQLVAEFKPN